MPDDELFTRAKDGALRKPDGDRQAGQADAGATGRRRAFSTAMVEQWMHTMAAGVRQARDGLLPELGGAPARRHGRGGERLLAPVLSGQVSAKDLLTAKYVYVNRALGTFYGLPGAASLPVDRFEKVGVTDNRRGGVLRQGSFLVPPRIPTPTRPPCGAS